MKNKSPKTIDHDDHYGHNNSLRAFLHIIYGIYGASILLGGLPLVIAVIMAYFKRGDSIETLYESHYDYLIQTFWRLICVTILGFIVGGAILLISALLIFPIFITWTVIPILIALITIWFLYRIVRGWLCLFENREIPLSYF